MKTVIIYTSKHGTTAKIAQMIAERLSGNQVSVVNLKKAQVMPFVQKQTVVFVFIFNSSRN
jgi:menaquinone-dependent protoporphyrinogen IX oxidase